MSSIYSNKKLYFLGICGTGMGNAAIFYKQKGYDIKGSDNRVYPPISDLLNENGIDILMPYQSNNITMNQDRLFIIGNSISRGNPELEYILQNKLPYTSFPELLRTTHLFSKKSIVIAGTHGKTTLSSLISYILDYAKLQPDYIIGGIPIDFNTGAHFDKGKYIILEGDEYDTAFFDKRPKFVHYIPDILILTSIELDHTDIYKDISQMEYAYHQMIRTMPQGSRVIACGDYPLILEILKKYSYLDIITYGIGSHNDFVVHRDNDIILNDQIIIKSRMPGIHNALNITAAYLLSSYLGIYSTLSIKAISQFQGIKRRLELFHQNAKSLFFDDFGHHPTAIKKTIEALKEKYPNKKILSVFEPRTNTTRTNVFLEEYKKAFAISDSLIIFDNKKLRKVADPLDLQSIKDYLNAKDKSCSILSDIYEILPILESDIIVLFSSGSMDGLRDKIKSL